MSFFAPLLRLILRKPTSFFDEEPYKSINMHLLRANYEDASKLLEKHEKSIAKMNEKDAQRARILDGIFKSKIDIEMGNSSSCIPRLKENLESFENLNLPMIEIYAYVTLTTAYEGSGDLNSALETVETGIAKLPKIKLLYPKPHDILQALLFNIQGKIIRKKGQIPEAMELLKESISIFEKYDMKYYTADPLNTLGICYVISGDNETSLATLDQSRIIYEELSNSSQLLKIYNNRAFIHRGVGNIDDALEDFNTAYEISSDLGIKNSSAAILMNIGMVYFDKGQLSESRKNFEQSLELFSELGNKPDMAKCLVNLGTLYSIFGDMAKSKEYYEPALEIYEDLQMEDEVGIIYKNMAQDFQYTEQLDKSKELWEKTLEIFRKTGNFFEQANVLSGLIDINLLKGETETAQKYLEEYKKEIIDQQQDNKSLAENYKLAKAKILIKSERVVQRAEAQKIFTEIADGDMISHLNKTEAMFALGELLLAELKATPSEEALDEFKELINRLEAVVRGEGNVVAVPRLVQVLILKSKLAIIDLEVDEGQRLMDEAYDLAKENELSHYASIIDEERKKYSDEMLKYKKMVDTNASLYDRLQQTNIENYLQRAEAILKR